MGRYVPNWLRREVAKINLERDLEEQKKREQKKAEFLKEHGPLYVVKFEENEYLEIAHYKEGKEERRKENITLDFRALGFQTRFTKKEIEDNFPQYWQYAVEVKE